MMQPSRELDALISERVMGLKLDPPHLRSHGPSYFDPPAYSSSIEAAWEVVGKFEGQALVIMPLRDPNADTWSRWRVTLSGPKNIEVIGMTAPHAICLAALKAVGHSV